MNLHNKNILLISPEPWDHIFVSKHHYATHLGAKGNRVFFLNPPTNEESCDATDYGNVFSVHYKGFIKGLRFLPSLMQRYLIRQKFDKLQQLCGVQFDIVWSFDNSVFYDFSALPEKVYCISHIVDLNQDFEFGRASKTAQICFAVSDVILLKQKIHNPNSFKIGHGYSVPKISPATTIELNGKNRVKCGYAGNLDIPYLDWELIESLLINHPEIDFYFVGKWTNAERKQSMTHYANFYYLGVFKSIDLPMFYSQCNILIITYLYEKYPDQLANPHKMMEYLGSGKPILATYTSEYEGVDLLYMTKLNVDWPSLFAEIVRDLPRHSTHNLAEKRRALALENSYENQIDRIMRCMK